MAMARFRQEVFDIAWPGYETVDLNMYIHTCTSLIPRPKENGPGNEANIHTYIHMVSSLNNGHFNCPNISTMNFFLSN